MKLPTHTYRELTAPGNRHGFSRDTEFIAATDLIDAIQQLYHMPDISFRSSEAILSELEMLAEGKEV